MMKMYLILYYEFLITYMIACDSVAMKSDHKFCTAWEFFLFVHWAEAQQVPSHNPKLTT